MGLERRLEVYTKDREAAMRDREDIRAYLQMATRDS